MPFRRYATKKTYRKKSTRKPTLSNSALSRKVNKISKQVKINKPVPLISTVANTNLDIFSTPTVATIQSLTGSMLATAEDQKQFIHSISLKGIVKMAVTSPDKQFFRLVLVKDNRRFDNDVAPTWLDVFHDTSFYSVRANTTDTAPNLQKGSFTVLKDITRGIIDDSASLRDTVRFTLSKHFTNPLRYENKTKYQRNQLYLMYMSTLATTECDLSFHATLRYTDIE